MQDPSNRWHRLMVPSGPEQAIRTTVGPNHVASKESVLRLASACLTGQQERGNEEIEIDAIIGDIRSGAIPFGGKAQYQARCRLNIFWTKRKLKLQDAVTAQHASARRRCAFRYASVVMELWCPTACVRLSSR